LILLQKGLENELPETRVVHDVLDQQRAGQQSREREAERRDQRVDGVTQHVLEHDLTFGQAFRTRRGHEFGPQ